MVNPVLCDNVSVPISYDIQINVTRTANILANTLDQIIFVTTEPTLAGDLTPGVGRVQFYSSLNDVIDAYGTDSASFDAASAFFSQSPRPQQLGIGQQFTDPQPGAMRTGVVAVIDDFLLVSDGHFSIVIDGEAQEVEDMNFTVDDLNYDDVAETIQDAIQAASITPAYEFATVTASAISGNDVTFTITSGTVGNGSTVSVLTAPVAGVDISGTDTLTSVYLNGTTATATLFLGYTPGDIATELALIYEAAQCQGKPPYGFVLDNIYLDTADQLLAAGWALGQDRVVLAIDVHDPATIDLASGGGNAQAILDTDNSRTVGYYSDIQEDLDAPTEYKAMSALALQLSWDTNGNRSYLDTSYKNMPGITLTSVSTSELDALRTRRTNVFTSQGAGNRVIKYNYTYSNDFALDERVAVDNLVNDLELALLTVFIRSKRLPYTLAGQAKQSQAMASVGEKYIRNGSLAARVVEDNTSESGQRSIPAYSIEFAPLQSVTAADRASNILRGVEFAIQLAGSIHRIVINLQVEG